MTGVGQDNIVGLLTAVKKNSLNKKRCIEESVSGDTTEYCGEGL